MEDLRAGWDRHVGFGLANPCLYTLICTEPQPGDPPPAARESSRVLAGRTARIADVGRLRVGAARATHLVNAAGCGTTSELISAPPSSRDGALATAAREAVIAAITTDPPSAPSPVTAVIALRAVLAQTPVLEAAERVLLADHGVVVLTGQRADDADFLAFGGGRARRRADRGPASHPWPGWRCCSANPSSGRWSTWTCGVSAGSPSPGRRELEGRVWDEAAAVDSAVAAGSSAAPPAFPGTPRRACSPSRSCWQRGRVRRRRLQRAGGPLRPVRRTRGAASGRGGDPAAHVAG